MSNVSDGHDAEIDSIRRSNKILLTRAFIFIGVCGLLYLAWVSTVSFITWNQSRPKPILTEIPGYLKESEVMGFITPGLLFQAVVEKYGEPDFSLDDGDGATRYFWFGPEPDVRFTYNWAFSGFTVIEKDGKVLWRDSVHMDTR